MAFEVEALVRAGDEASARASLEAFRAVAGSSPRYALAMVQAEAVLARCHTPD